MQSEQENRIHYSTITFRSLLDSLARPGKITVLEYPRGFDKLPRYSSSTTPVNIYALAAMMTLLDKEVTFAIAVDGTWLPSQDELVRWIVLRTGSRVASPEDAAFAFFCGSKSDGLLRQLSVGTLAEPESSATAFYCVQQIGDAPSENEEQDRVKLRLSGPGIKDATALYTTGLEHGELQDILDMRQGYPLGVDIYLIDAVGRCVGLPRTTRIKG